MLVLLQLSVGTLGFGALLPGASDLARAVCLALAAASALVGLLAATLHLGRPLYAFRAFLGWRTSWMSREILVFGAYVPAVALAAAASAVAPLGIGPAWALGLARTLLPASLGSALALGLAGTACSVMIYVDTRRPAWALSRTGPIFAGTLVGLGALGAATASALGAWAAGRSAPVEMSVLALAGLLALAGKLAGEALLLVRRRDGAADPVSRTARLLRGALRRRVRLRFAAAAAGVPMLAAAVGVAAAGASGWAAVLAAIALAGFALGELIERHLYFTSESSPGMPGH
jgi:DMSO reductase anchor subunit